jgi:hypothetical protein
MDTTLLHGLLLPSTTADGQPCVKPAAAKPAMIPCPTTGHPLRVATIDAHAPAICPGCSAHGRGAFVSFVSDLRMAYACPACRQLVWLPAV